ncbi:MAG: hypothetical protein HQ541_04270 [Mariniphaga sp.]|nr:hypothetical protein [Mariniphaga sp.]
MKKLQVLQDSTHIYNLEELIDYAEKYNIPKLIENKKLVERNYKLMQLSNVDISESIKTIVKEKINEKIPRLAKYKIQVMILEDKLFTAIKNSTV